MSVVCYRRCDFDNFYLFFFYLLLLFFFFLILWENFVLRTIFLPPLLKILYILATNTVTFSCSYSVSSSVRNRRKFVSFVSFLMNVHWVNDIWQTELHTAESLVPEQSVFEIELAIEKLKSHKSPGIDQIPAEFIKARSRTIRHYIHKLIIFIWNKEELP